MYKLTIYPSDGFKKDNPLLNTVALFSLTVALYAVGQFIGHHGTTLFWPMNAVLAGLFIRHRPLRQPYYYTIFVLAVLFAGLVLDHYNLIGILMNMSDIAFVAILSWLILKERQPAEPHLKITIFRLYSYCLLTGILCAILGSYFYALLHQSDFWQIYPAWLSEEFTTSVLVLPVILIRRAECTPRRITLSRPLPLVLLVLSLTVSITTGTPESMGTLSMILPALIWCAIVYSLPTTCVLTLLAGVVEVLMVNQKVSGLHLMGQIPPIISARLGIAAIALSPLIVAVSVEAINALVKQLSHQVRYDYLTRVYSRFGLYERLKELDGNGHTTALNVLILDIDHFKHINDTWGHDCGDRVLTAFAGRVKSVVGKLGIVARLGGEEFAVIMAGKPGDAGLQLAEEIRQAVEEMEVEWDSKKLSLTVSIGLSYGTAMRQNIVDIFDKLLSEADGYLYQSKKTGRNRTSAPSALGIR